MIAYKSKIFISKDQKTDINQKIFIINQLYNFMISKMLEEDFQYDLCEQNFGKFIPFDDSTKFVISKKSKVRNVLNEDFKKYYD